MVTFKQLRYALALQEFRHFKRAAEACSVSQAALSTSVSELENQLGVQIFERDRKGILLTAAGEEILEQARQVDLAIADLERIALLSKGPLTGDFSLGVIPTIGPFLLPKILPKLRAQYPTLRLNLIEQQTHVLIDRVLDGALDTAIVALPYPLEGLHSFEFWRENFLVVLNREHPLAKNKSIKSTAIDPAELLLLEDGHCLTDHALEICRLRNAIPQNSLSGTSLYTLVQMVAGKMGITLIPEVANSLIANIPEIVSIPLAEDGPHRSFAFIARLNYPGTKNLEELLALSRKILSA
ncbi:MAG: hydrogen peroxide-inducible genes activator [Pseudomonadota bacterium]